MTHGTKLAKYDHARYRKLIRNVRRKGCLQYYYFCEMKEDVGMSHHEKGGNRKMPTPRHSHSQPRPYIFVFQSFAGHECTSIQTIDVRSYIKTFSS